MSTSDKLRIAIVASFFCASCSEMPPQARDGDHVSRTGGQAGIVSVNASPDDCEFRWDDEPVSADEIFNRGTLIIENAIVAHGGAENMTYTDIPYLRVSSEENVPYQCISIIIGTIRRVGFPSAELAVSRSANSIFLDFEIFTGELPPESSFPRRVIAIDDGGAVYLEGQRISDESLAQRAVENLSGDPVAASFVPVLDVIAIPDYYLLPSARSRFERVVEIASLLKNNNVYFNLAGCYLNDFEAELLTQQIGDPLPRC